MRHFAISAAALATLTFSAQAADLGRPVAVPEAIVVAPAPSWTGFYLGATAGGTFGTAGRTTSTVFDPTGYFAATSVPAVAAAGLQSSSTSGFTGGATAGYNLQWGNVVGGLETDFQYFGQNGNRTTTAAYPCCAPATFSLQSRASTNWLWTLRPRIGVLATPSLLVYATGGLALTNLQSSFQFSDTFGAQASGSLSSTRAGYTIGLGAEYAIASNWTVKVEYLYFNFGRATSTSTNLSTPAATFPANTFTQSANLNSNMVRLGINYVFSTGPGTLGTRY
jgi:outer membrane immunogenic protein